MHSTWKRKVVLAQRRLVLLKGDSNSLLYEGVQQNSVDSVVTDAPYGYFQAGHEWDRDVISFKASFWSQVYRVLKPGGYLLSLGGAKTYHRMACAVEDAGFEIKPMLGWAYLNGFPIRKTQLKPALEPILMARKPCVKNSLPLNLLQYGTGLLNIDQNRVGSRKVVTVPRRGGKSPSHLTGGWSGHADSTAREGLWPANFIVGHEYADQQVNGHGLTFKDMFFVVKKPSTQERGIGNNHPTVKPVALMRHLIRLVTPQEGVVLDPFAGSGSTGIACVQEKMGFIGIEKVSEYVVIARRRITQSLKG